MSEILVNSIKSLSGTSAFELDSDGSVSFDTSTLHIDATNNRVGIGTTTINRGQLQIASAGNTELHLTGSGQTGSGEGLTITSNSTEGNIWYRNNGYFRIATNNSERMRIDASGNLLVGKTSDGVANAGFEANNAGYIGAAQSGTVGYFNRISSDGEIFQFRKDNTAVGSIGTVTGDLYIGDGDTNIRFNNAADAVTPATTGGSGRDAAIDLGTSIVRYKNLYLSGGVYVGGTGAANYLDDYEEGTFTPGFQYSGNGTHSSSFHEQFGYYRKIGGVVHCSVFLRWSSFSKGTATGSAQVNGLPFTSANLGRFYGSGGWNAYQYPADTSKQFTFTVEASSSVIDLYDVGNNTFNDQINDPTAGSEFKMFVTYFTDA